MITASMYCTKWYMEVFSSSLPFPYVIRVWDVLFCEGSKTLYRVAMAILKILQKDLLKLGFEEIMDKLRDLSKCLTATPDEVISTAMEFSLSSKRIKKLTKEYEVLQAQQGQ